MKKLFVLCLLMVPLMVSAQFVKDRTGSAGKETPKVDFGIGLGLDYGGIGGRLTYLPDKHFGVFGSVGYALVGAGYNFGVKGRFNPDSRFCVTSGAMYGYNGVIKVTGASQYDKIYYGPSASLGLEIRSKSNPKNYFNLELVIPFRSQAFTDDVNALKSNPSIKATDPLPVAFSIGYHIGF